MLVVPIIPENTTRWNDDVLILGQRRRRWANIETSLFQRVLLAAQIFEMISQEKKTREIKVVSNEADRDKDIYNDLKFKKTTLVSMVYTIIIPRCEG